MGQKIRVTILIILFIGAGMVLLLINQEDTKSEEEFNILQEIATKPVEQTDQIEQEEVKGISKESYNELYEMNNDFKGWLKIPNTNVDYPVMQSSEPNFYLNKDFNKKYSSYGVPYIDDRYVIETSQNVLIYGHSMTNTTMFADLLKYKSQAFFTNNNTIQYTDINGYTEYKIFAVFEISTTDEFDYHNYINMDLNRYDEYISKAINYSLYNADIIPEFGDKLITLSTCENSSDDLRFVVIGAEI